MEAKDDQRTVFKPPKDETFLKWGLIYPRNPRYQYLYPSPTVSILTNIANALAAYPKFYVQTLHLMNKMNLPAPFGQTTPTPPVASEELKESSSETEIESDSEEQKRQNRQKKSKRLRATRQETMPLKRMKLIEDFPTLPSVPVETSEVFDLDSQATGQKQIQLKIPTAIELQTASDNIQPIPKTTESNMPGQGGFGVIEPPPKPVETINTEEESDCKEFISEKELKRGCLSESKRKEVNVFKKYNKGDPSSRLYIKNLAKNTTEKDLKYIYGRYVDWSNDTEANAFDVRVMKEGRMKGQAFVTLPTETVAVKALNDSLAFVLHDKPMVVQFARSAKATADPNTEDK